MQIRSAFQPRGRDIKRERRSVRYVEALDRARQIERASAIAGLARQLTQALAFGAEHERERRMQRASADRSASPSLSRSDQQEIRAPSAPPCARARFCTVTIGTYSSAPDADLASTPVASGEWRAVVTSAFTPNAAAAAQDRADIVRIGDLVEHQHDAFVGELGEVRRLRADRPRRAGRYGRHPPTVVARSRPAARSAASPTAARRLR